MENENEVKEKKEINQQQIQQDSLKKELDYDKKQISNLSTCKTVHDGIKCDICLKMPIIGCRYKCSICNNYNLCENCEEKNANSHIRNHNFIKLRIKEALSNQINNNNNNNSIYNNNINNNLVSYNNNQHNFSFKCLNIQELTTTIIEEEDEAKFTLLIQNNGNQTWPKDKTKLIFDRKSMFIKDNVILLPQQPGDTKTYSIYFNGLRVYQEGEYYSYLRFYVDGFIYGDMLTLKIIIKEKEEINDINPYDLNKEKEKIEKEEKEKKEREEKEKKEREEKDEIILKFKIEFNLLDGDVFSDEKIYEALKKNNFNFNDAFEYLFT